MEQQVGQVIQMAQTVLTEMNKLRESVATEVNEMKKVLNAEAAQKNEVVMKAELPGLKAAMMTELGTFSSQNLTAYSQAMQDGIKTVLDSHASEINLELEAQAGEWKMGINALTGRMIAAETRLTAAEQFLRTLMDRDIEREKTLARVTEERSGGAPVGVPGEGRGSITELKSVQALEKYSGDRGQFGRFRDELEEAICGNYTGWRGVLDYIGNQELEVAITEDEYNRQRAENPKATAGWPLYDKINSGLWSVLVLKTLGEARGKYGRPGKEKESGHGRC